MERRNWKRYQLNGDSAAENRRMSPQQIAIDEARHREILASVRTHTTVMSDALDPPAPKAKHFVHEPSHWDASEERRVLAANEMLRARRYSSFSKAANAGHRRPADAGRAGAGRSLRARVRTAIRDRSGVRSAADNLRMSNESLPPAASIGSVPHPDNALLLLAGQTVNRIDRLGEEITKKRRELDHLIDRQANENAELLKMKDAIATGTAYEPPAPAVPIQQQAVPQRVVQSVPQRAMPRPAPRPLNATPPQAPKDPA